MLDAKHLRTRVISDVEWLGRHRGHRIDTTDHAYHCANCGHVLLRKVVRDGG